MYSNRASPRGGRQKRAGGCTLKIWANPQPASNASPLHGSVRGVAGGCGQCCGTRQRCKSTAARAGGEAGDQSPQSSEPRSGNTLARTCENDGRLPKHAALDGWGAPADRGELSFARGQPAARWDPPTPAVPPGRPLVARGTEGSARPRVGRGSRRARAGPRYPGTAASSQRPLQQLRSAHRRAAGTPARERSAPASCWRRAAHEERDRTRRRPWPPSPRRPRTS